MSVAEAPVPAPTPGASKGFAPRHKADAIFFPCLLAFIWIGLLFGFAPEIHDHMVQHKSPYPWIVHIHAMVFFGWMALLTTQLTLVRGQNLALHRRLGRVAFYWGPVLLIVGLVTPVIVDRARFGTPDWDPQFISIQWADLLDFAILLAFALRLRGDGTTHKRLMLLAITALGNAGFSRWWGLTLEQWLGAGYLPFLLELYLADFLIIASLLGYDLVTRGRPHPAVVMGGALIVAVESIAAYLYFNPWWITLSDRLLRP